MSTPVTLVGRLGQDPELRFTPSGTAVCTMSLVTSKPKRRDDGSWEDTDQTWWRVTVWKNLAERCAETLRKGNALIVSGRAYTRAYETSDGRKGTSLECEAFDVGINLRWTEAAVVQPVQRSGGGGQGAGVRDQPARSRQPQDDPWATPATSSGGGYPQDPPF